ncbi:DNA polymerase ligase-domain-containing protein [Aspergillus crustosus]
MHHAEHMNTLANEHPTRRLSSLAKPISPPPARPSPGSLSRLSRLSTPAHNPSSSLSLPALEAGAQSVPVGDHLPTIAASLSNYISPHSLLPLDQWKALYTSNSHPQGHHFVIHQHDHPIAGPHYDLRLQFSESSSLSWSIMYGLPGDPNSRRLSRNATETRVHCFWNHLIETASANTGSMIIWDTGVYEVLPERPQGQKTGPETETETDADSDSNSESDLPSASNTESRDGRFENEKLRKAFQNHKIHLRLHGTRLPTNYTVFLRRDKSDFRSPATPTSIAKTSRKRRRRPTVVQTAPSTTSESESETEYQSTGIDSGSGSGLGKRRRTDPSRNPNPNSTGGGEGEHSDGGPENPETDYLIRLNNAYPGSTNDIGSIHQRRWFLMLDRLGCGFTPQSESDPAPASIPENAGSNTTRSVTRPRTWKKRWIRGVDKRSGMKTGFEPFYVRGPAVERSVVTGRLGGDVLRDEGVDGFIPRKGWSAVLM